MQSSPPLVARDKVSSFHSFTVKFTFKYYSVIISTNFSVLRETSSCFLFWRSWFVLNVCKKTRGKKKRKKKIENNRGEALKVTMISMIRMSEMRVDVNEGETMMNDVNE